MADPYYPSGLIIAEKGKPTHLVKTMVYRDYNFTLARAYLSANQAGIASATTVKVLLDTEEFDLGNNFANYRYVCPITGYYQINFGVYGYSASDKLTQVISFLYKNGVQYGFGGITVSPDVGWLRSVGSDVFYGEKYDYLELYGQGTTSDASTLQFASGIPATFMSIYLISNKDV